MSAKTRSEGREVLDEDQRFEGAAQAHEDLAAARQGVPSHGQRERGDVAAEMLQAFASTGGGGGGGV